MPSKSSLLNIKDNIMIFGTLAGFYAFSYELLSEQSQSDYKKILITN